MNFNLEKNDGKIIITLDGRLDTVNSVSFNEFIEANKEEITSSAEATVSLNFKDLEYISSAGLRALLALKKYLSQFGKTLVVENINNVVREVFEVTGFGKIVKID